MQDERKTKKQLVRELRTLHAKLKRLEKSEEKRRQLVDGLRESEERYHSILDNSNDAILLTAPDGGVFSANPAACRMFGRTEKEICRLGRDGVVDTTDPRLQKGLRERELTGRFKAARFRR
jgi:PAS domain-containing protein